MTLKPYSEALFNTLEHLDSKPVASKEGVPLDNLKAGAESYLIEQAINDGYIVEVPGGSAKYKPTIEGIVLLNQMRLKKAIERANYSAKISAWVNGILAFVIGVATITVTIVFAK